MSSVTPPPPQSFKELAELIDSMGVAWSVVVQTALATMEPGMDEATRIQRLAAEFRRRCGPADAELAEEQVKAAVLLRNAPVDDPLRPELMDMVLAFTEQREGLQLLVRFFEHHDAAHLHAAQHKVRQGMERARAAAQRASHRVKHGS